MQGQSLPNQQNGGISAYIPNLQSRSSTDSTDGPLWRDLGLANKQI